MGEENWLELTGQMQSAAILRTNEKTEGWGLRLTEEDAALLLQERKNVLREQKRVEFGEGILPKLIEVFCDSVYISQDHYVETLIRLQEIFYSYKNEMMDEITDEELLNFMKEQYETVCYGELEYLEGTCLEIFAKAIRAGYRGYQESGGIGEFEKFDEVKRWDRELYLETLRDLCWR